MRTKLMSAVAIVVATFLLVTNPVVAEAAKKITGKQIKDNSVTTKDIKNNNLTGQDVKNGSLAAADLAAGTIPPPTVFTVKRFLSGSLGIVPNSATLGFVGNTTTITVDGNDAIVASASLDVFGTLNDDIDVSICTRPVGAATTPTPLGGSNAIMGNIDYVGGDNEIGIDAVGIPAAGSYTVGVCAAPSTGNSGSTFIDQASGYAFVLNTTGSSLARPASGGLASHPQ
jgi:hypothetical protein